jgi:hypothetical protein
MSYQEKYLKYKSKYLQLKALKKNLQQLGGNKNDADTEDSLMNVNNLSETPTHSNVFVKPKKNSKKSKRSHNSRRSESSDLFSSSTESSMTNSFDVSSTESDL